MENVTSVGKMAIDLDASIKLATNALIAAQKEDGHWIYELEPDATITAQYVLLAHHLGAKTNDHLERKIARYLRRIQSSDGGWPLFTDGRIDVSASTQAYFALKLIGDSPGAEHMVRARDAILKAGGAEASNVFTRIFLALYGVLPWEVVPIMPVEIMFLPQWFPFHLSKISCWARTALVPLLVIKSKQPTACNPRGVRVDELFRCAPAQVGPMPRAPHQSEAWFSFFGAMDRVLRVLDRFAPTHLRQRALDAAVAFVDERLHSEQGLAATFTMTMYAAIMYDAIGRPPDHPSLVKARGYIENLLVVGDNEAYCQVSQSPVWDTVLVAHALLDSRDPDAIAAARRGLQWLRPRQILDTRGDWAWHRPKLRPGGWAFQYACPHYPDVDDTAVIAMAMHRLDRLDGSTVHAKSIARAREWVVGMQSSVGGWGAFEPENIHFFLENVPFSDHGALLNPPSADVTGRCLSMMAQLGDSLATSKPMRRACDYLLQEQEADGSWFGRWGVNYIHGTWSALCALNAIGMPHDDERIRRAVRWLVGIQNEDGGWGEDGSSYNLDHRGHEWAPSTPTQTSWALLGLMAAGAVNHPAVARGIQWLLEAQREHGTWDETLFTATGFPRVFFLRYHGYPKYFPLWALARYRTLKRDNLVRVTTGM